MVLSAIFLLGIEGKLVLAKLMVVLMVAYILDLLQMQQGVMFMVCGLLCAMGLAMIFTGSTFTVSLLSVVLYMMRLFVVF
jgi:hypothetical protein